jgi:hypothetical protein
VNAPDYKPLFDYLEHEAKFQTAVATVTGGAAAFWLKAIFTRQKDPAPEPYPIATRLAAALLAVSSFLCLLDQGRIAKKYGELADVMARGAEPDSAWRHNVVRGRWDTAALIQWSPYFGARLLLYVVGAIVLWMLYRDWQTVRRNRDVAENRREG